MHIWRAVVLAREILTWTWSVTVERWFTGSRRSKFPLEVRPASFERATSKMFVRGWKNKKKTTRKKRVCGDFVFFRWRKGKKRIFPLCSHDCLPAPVANASSCIRSMDPRSIDDPARAELFASAWSVLPFFYFRRKSNRVRWGKSCSYLYTMYNIVGGERLRMKFFKFCVIKDVSLPQVYPVVILNQIFSFREIRSRIKDLGIRLCSIDLQFMTFVVWNDYCYYHCKFLIASCNFTSLKTVLFVSIELRSQIYNSCVIII